MLETFNGILVEAKHKTIVKLLEEIKMIIITKNYKF